MARTMPATWKGLEPRPLTQEVLSQIEQQYQSAQADEDKAGEIEDAAFYEGFKTAMLVVLDAMYGTRYASAEQTSPDPDECPECGHWLDSFGDCVNAH